MTGRRISSDALSWRLGRLLNPGKVSPQYSYVVRGTVAWESHESWVCGRGGVGVLECALHLCEDAPPEVLWGRLEVRLPWIDGALVLVV